MLIEAAVATGICLVVGLASKRGAKASLSCMHGLHEYEVVEDLGHAAHAQCRNCGKKVTAVA